MTFKNLFKKPRKTFLDHPSESLEYFIKCCELCNQTLSHWFPQTSCRLWARLLLPCNWARYNPSGIGRCAKGEPRYVNN